MARVILLFLAAFAPILAAGEAPPPPQQIGGVQLRSVDDVPLAPLDEGVFLQSGDLKIQFAAVQRVESVYMAAQIKENPKFKHGPIAQAGVRREIAAQLLQNAVLERYAEQHKLAASKEELDAEIEKFRSHLNASGTNYQQFLADTAQTDAEFRRYWGAKFAVEQDLGKSVTPDDLAAARKEALGEGGTKIDAATLAAGTKEIAVAKRFDALMARLVSDAMAKAKFNAKLVPPPPDEKKSDE